jgi:hypothetical protein
MKIPNACKDLFKQPNAISSQCYIICFQERVKALNESMNLKMKLGFCPRPQKKRKKPFNKVVLLQGDHQNAFNGQRSRPYAREVSL